MVSNNFMKIQMGGGVFELGNPEEGGSSSFGNLGGRGGGGGQKAMPSVGGVRIFSGITQYIISNPCIFSFLVSL